MRRFEFQEDASHKFWEVYVAGDTLAVRYGKVGTQGQTQTKEFKSEDAAQRAADKLVQEKLGKGYVEVTAPKARTGAAAKAGAARARPASAPATRVLLRDASDGEERILLLAGKRFAQRGAGKWHIQSFDSAADAKDYFERLLFLDSKGGLKPVETTHPTDEQVEAELARAIESFPGTHEIEDGRCTIKFEGSSDEKVSPAACKSLVKWLALEAPRSVRLICEYLSPKQAWAQALQGVMLPSVKSFVFDVSYKAPGEQSRNSIGDLAAVLAACPNLERLFVTGDLSLSPVRHESLRQLYLFGNPLTASLFENLGRSEFPRLERVAVMLAEGKRPLPYPAILETLRTLRAPVREVYLDGFERVSDTLEALATGGIPPSWKVLAFEEGWGTDFESDEVNAVLQRHAGAFSGLEVLGLPNDVEVEGAPVPTRPTEELQERFTSTVYMDW